MSDAFAIPEVAVKEEIQPGNYSTMTQQDTAIIHAKTERKLIIESLDNGSLACLPGKDGFADTEAAKNVVKNTIYHGSSQIILKDFQKRNGYPTAEYCTREQMEKAEADTGQKIYIKKGSHGVTLNFLVDGEQKSVRLFNLAQVNNPDAIRTYAAHQAESRENYFKMKYGENYHPRTTTGTGTTITCTSTNPDRYLGEYLAAISVNGKFKVSPEQAAEFVAKTKEFIFARNSEGHINPFNLNVLGSLASKHCRDILPEVRVEGAQKVPVREQTRSQSQDMGR